MSKQNYNYEAPVTGKMCLGYYPEWAMYDRKYEIADTPVDVLTHMHYAFIDVNEQTFKLQLADPWADTDRAFYDTEYCVFGPMPTDTWIGPQQQQLQEKLTLQQDKLKNKDYDIKKYETLPQENWEMEGLQQNSFNYGFNGNFKRMQILKDFKKKYQGAELKLVASVGGWTQSKNYPALIGSQEHIDVFAQSCCDFVTKYYFDGIDIDFEYICFGPQGNYDTPKFEESQQFTSLLQTVRRKLDELGEQTGKEYSLSITTSCDPDKMRPLEWHKIVAVCDYVVLMTYDFAGSWDPTSAHQTPFFYNPRDKRKSAKTFNISSCLKFLKSENISLSNFILGSPAYGRTWVCEDGMFSKVEEGKKALKMWEDNFIEYSVMVGQSPVPQFKSLDQYFNQNQACCLYDEVSQAAYFQNDQDGNVVTYDSVRSLQDKLDCVFDEEMKGIFFWDLSGDVRYYLDKSKSLVYSAAHYIKSHEEEIEKQLKQIYIQERKEKQQLKLQQQQQQNQEQQDQSSCNIF